MNHFSKTSVFECSCKKLFDWHARPGALRRLVPPWEDVRLLRETPGLGIGKRVALSIGTPIGRRVWEAEHIRCMRGKEFVDTQVEGPFSSWTHQHLFKELGEHRCEMEDLIEYELPLGGVGRFLATDYVERKLRRSFDYRHAVTEMDIRFRQQLGDFQLRRILVTGGSGFLGTKLVWFLRMLGHNVSILTRRKTGEGEIRWNPAKGEIELPKLERFDAVIHLAGESLTGSRWTKERKQSLWESRVTGTRFLVDALLRLEHPPKVFLSGSGIGFYGASDGEPIDESAEKGDGFLADLCEAWEAAALRAEALGCRVALLRTGVVLDPQGGALAKMLPIFGMGLGGRLGTGKQWFPWIALEDWIRATAWCLHSQRAEGPLNFVSPKPMRQFEFARKLGETLNRPSFLPAPSFALKALFGDMAEQALLSGCRAKPSALDSVGYRFEFPDLAECLKFSLGR